MAKNARLLELGPANIYLYVKPRASLTIDASTSNADIYVQANIPGDPVDGGNSISIALVEPGTPNPTLSVAVDGLDIVVTLETSGGGPGSSVSTAQEVIDLLNNDPAAGFLISAAKVAGQDGTGIIGGHSAANLTGGSETGVARDVGYVGDEVAYQITTEVADLTGAQKGNVALDKVVIGGMVKVVLPFKEINMDNFQAGIPLTRLVENSDKTKRRLDFLVTVGRSMRQTALKMEIRKIKGGFESALPADRIIIPEISPADGDVTFPFAPTTQRQIMTNWYAWPDDSSGRWAFTGDENP